MSRREAGGMGLFDGSFVLLESEGPGRASMKYTQKKLSDLS